MRIFFILFLVLFIGNNVSTNAQEIVLEKKLEAAVIINSEELYNSYHEANLSYQYFDQKGFLRREKNKLVFFDEELQKKWEYELASEGGATRLYRIVRGGNYLYLAWYSKSLEYSTQSVRMGKIDIETGEFQEGNLEQNRGLKSVQYMEYRAGSVYLFCTTDFSNELWSSSLPVPFYKSIVLKLDENLNEIESLTIPELLTDYKTKVNWMFLGTADTGFTYVTYYRIKGDKMNPYNGTLGDMHEERRTFDYDFVMTGTNVVKKWRDDYYLNPIKFDTSKFSLSIPNMTNYCTLSKRIISTYSGTSSAAYYLYANYYPIIYGIIVKKKQGGQKVSVLPVASSLLKINKSYPRFYWRFVDAVGDPINQSVTILLAKPLPLATVYAITINENMVCTQLREFKGDQSGAQVANDYNYSMVPKKASKVLSVEGTKFRRNAFDFMADFGIGKICSVVNKENSQVVFLDDPNTDEVMAFELK